MLVVSKIHVCIITGMAGVQVERLTVKFEKMIEFSLDKVSSLKSQIYAF